MATKFDFQMNQSSLFVVALSIITLGLKDWYYYVHY